MWYAMFSEDVESSLPLRKIPRAAHLVRLEELANAERLLVAGPHPAIDNEEPGEEGFTGSLIVAQFESLKAAQAWADQDPYVLNNVYKKVVVKPYKRVLP